MPMTRAAVLVIGILLGFAVTLLRRAPIILLTAACPGLAGAGPAQLSARGGRAARIGRAI
jgi:hypothetical protein